MNLIDTFIGLAAPHDCLVCQKEGAVLCADCQKLLPASVPRCYRCRQPNPEYNTCQRCRAASSLASVMPATIYDNPIAKQLLWKLKSDRTVSVANDMAMVMAPLLKPFAGSGLLVHVPTATRRVRQRGYDQAALLTRAVARLTGNQSAVLLARTGHTKQVGANRYDRQLHLANALHVIKPYKVRGQAIILIDDVITTGATLEAAATIMRQAGANDVHAITFAAV
jgi:ComF family protein